jgi:hypothetical protein
MVERYSEQCLGQPIMKISEIYETFKAGEQGPFLFCILMRNHLLSDTKEEEAALSLNEKVKSSQSSPSKERIFIKL